MSQFDIISDQSKKKLYEVPKEILNMCNLKMLYLEGNSIRSLPEDFFLKLHKLTWLDLRNNKIKEIPENIAYHEHLENLLLTNNRIERLPNELGLVPRLKVLQVAENPIIYPSRKVIAEGFKSIMTFLKKQYEKSNKERNRSQPASVESEGCTDSAEDTEQEIAVVEESGSGYIAESDEASSIKDILKRSHKGRLHQGDDLPSISVKGLSKQDPVTTHGDAKNKKGKIVHKVTRGGSKISLRSHYNSNKYVDINKMKTNFDRIQDIQVKEEWLKKLKVVLAEQESILQQEKNLKALNEWRSEKRLEPPRIVEEDERPVPPFATDEEYERMISRDDLSKQIDKMIQRSRHKPKRASIEKLINDLVSQLKEMENTYVEMKSPRTEIEQAGKQIKMIMNIHKKLLRLQASNDSTLQ